MLAQPYVSRFPAALGALLMGCSALFAEEIDHAAMGHATAMPGMLGAPMSREASGTSWQPDLTPHMGRMEQRGEWHVMTHGLLNGVYNHQGGRRGDEELFGFGMYMAMAQRPWAGGTLGLRGMVSPDPLLVGKDGYALLLQTGETADGREPLIDRQHPHDLFMELAASYSRPLGMGGSGFVYAGLAGEPALGPPAFMHRYSALANPEAPLGHHWLDSTHISFGVLTAGYVRGRWKIEASAFNGREPDEDRYDLEFRALSSSAVRLSWNPAAHWALQLSHGRLKSPEQLEPDVDIARTIASASYHQSVERLSGAQWQSTIAWGRNSKDPGAATDVLLLESAMHWAMHGVFARYETAEKDELFDHDHARHGQVFDVQKLSVGYMYSWPLGSNARLGVGAVVSQYFTPRTLDPEYGSDPRAFMIFARLAWN